jgi:hypothetical protein
MAKAIFRLPRRSVHEDLYIEKRPENTRETITKILGKNGTNHEISQLGHTMFEYKCKLKTNNSSMSTSYL